METNTPYSSGEDSVMLGKLDCMFKSQRLYIDNRNIGRRDVQFLSMGDLWRPWYFFKDLGNGETNCPTDTNSVSLLYDVTIETLDPATIGDCCFNHAHRFGDGHYYDSPGLLKSLEEEGQKKYIDCVVHHSNDHKNQIRFKDGSTTSDICVFEGHHRKHNLLKLGKKAECRVFHFYDLPWPLTKDALETAFNKCRGSELWSDYQTEDSKNPWFTLSHFENPSSSHKYASIMKCLDLIRSKGIKLTFGMDIGCGEGLYGFLAGKELDIEVYGVDTEAAQIIRSWLAKMIFKNDSFVGTVGSWDNLNKTTDVFADFGMLLSVTHHMENPAKFFAKFCNNKNAVIAEIRHDHGDKVLPGQICGSIKGFQAETQVKDMLNATGMKWQHVLTQDGNRNFYTLWRE